MVSFKEFVALKEKEPLRREVLTILAAYRESPPLSQNEIKDLLPNELKDIIYDTLHDNLETMVELKLICRGPVRPSRGLAGRPPGTYVLDEKLWEEYATRTFTKGYGMGIKIVKPKRRKDED